MVEYFLPFELTFVLIRYIRMEGDNVVYRLFPFQPVTDQLKLRKRRAEKSKYVVFWTVWFFFQSTSKSRCTVDGFVG